MIDKFEYDVAFSFVAKDEMLAVELNDLLSSRFKTFLYSERQKELAGTDGEESFKAVFGAQSRLVVVLYRHEWGETPWTRIEETAIRDRAHEYGYDFSVFIPLDKPPSCPKWLPKNRLWVDLERWDAIGAAAVIEQRIQDQGGEPHEESVYERAARHARDAQFKKERETSLNSEAGARAFLNSISAIKKQMIEDVDKIKSNESLLHLRVVEKRSEFFILGLDLSLGLLGESMYSNTLDHASLDVTLWQGAPPVPGSMRFEKPVVYKSRRFVLDYLRSGDYVWVEKSNKQQAYSSQKLAENLLKWLFDENTDSGRDR